jgi:hypothetical protein
MRRRRLLLAYVFNDILEPILEYVSQYVIRVTVMIISGNIRACNMSTLPNLPLSENMALIRRKFGGK